MTEASNNVIAAYAIENANLRLQVEELKIENLRLSEEIAKKEEDKPNGKQDK